MVCRFAYEDAIIAAGYSDGCVRVYNLNTDNKISQIDTNVGKQ
jgi:WD40 repeat protein